MSLDALKILQEYSDRMVQTVYDKDFEAHKNGFHIPFSLISTEGDITMYSREQLRFGFDSVLKLCAGRSNLTITRRVQDATLTSDTRLLGSYTTVINAADEVIMPEWQSATELVLENGVWRAKWIANDLTRMNWPTHPANPENAMSNNSTEAHNAED